MRLFLGTFFILCITCSLTAQAQELNCQVKVNYDQTNSTQVTDRQIFPQLQTFITDFMNNRRWTNDAFSPEERINCRLIIDVLKVPAPNTYEGRAQLIVTRPVYGTSYETIIYRYIDQSFNFSYRLNDPMYFNESNYSSELTSLLAFHALIVLGMDYDSFGKQGGRMYFQRASNVLNLALSSMQGGGGWSAQGDLRNRYWLIENLQNQQFVPFREGLYTYHRLTLDDFSKNPASARQQILDILTTIREVSQQRPNSIVINIFFDAKGEEMFNIMNEGTRDERQKAYTILSSLDPSKTEFYRRLLR